MNSSILEECHILFDDQEKNPQAVYNSGQKVSGRLLVKCSKKFDCDMSLHVLGYCEVLFTEPDPTDFNSEQSLLKGVSPLPIGDSYTLTPSSAPRPSLKVKKSSSVKLSEEFQLEDDDDDDYDDDDDATSSSMFSEDRFSSMVTGSQGMDSVRMNLASVVVDKKDDDLTDVVDNDDHRQLSEYGKFNIGARVKDSVKLSKIQPNDDPLDAYGFQYQLPSAVPAVSKQYNDDDDDDFVIGNQSLAAKVRDSAKINEKKVKRDTSKINNQLTSSGKLYIDLPPSMKKKNVKKVTVETFEGLDTSGKVSDITFPVNQNENNNDVKPAKTATDDNDDEDTATSSGLGKKARDSAVLYHCSSKHISESTDDDVDDNDQSLLGRVARDSTVLYTSVNHINLRSSTNDDEDDDSAESEPSHSPVPLTVPFHSALKTSRRSQASGMSDSSIHSVSFKEPTSKRKEKKNLKPSIRLCSKHRQKSQNNNNNSSVSLRSQSEISQKSGVSKKGSYQSSGVASKSTIALRDTEGVFNDMEIYMEEDQTVHDGILTPGEHIYPFTFILARHFPTSFESPHGFIRYQVFLVINDMICARRYFTVVRQLDLNTESPRHRLPVTQVDHFPVNGGCCFKWLRSDIRVSVSIPKRAFVPGERIPFFSYVKNNSQINLDNLSYEVEQCITYRVKSQTKTVRRLISEVKTQGVWPTNFCHVSELLPVPAIPPSGLRGCKLIDVEYYFKINGIRKPFVSVQRHCYRLLIGTMPLLDNFDDDLQVLYDIDYEECTLDRKGGVHAFQTFTEQVIYEKDPPYAARSCKAVGDTGTWVPLYPVYSNLKTHLVDPSVYQPGSSIVSMGVL